MTESANEVKLYGKWSFEDIEVSDISLQVCVCVCVCEYIYECVYIHIREKMARESAWNVCG